MERMENSTSRYNSRDPPFKAMYNETLGSTHKPPNKSGDNVNIGIIISVICFTALLVGICVLIVWMKRWKKVKESGKMVRQESGDSTHSMQNDDYDQSQNSSERTLQSNTEQDISIVLETATTSKKQRNTYDDHTLNFFLQNVESGLSDKHHTDTSEEKPSRNLRNSTFISDALKDHILCGFLKSFESSEMCHVTKKEGQNNTTKEINTNL